MGTFVVGPSGHVFSVRGDFKEKAVVETFRLLKIIKVPLNVVRYLCGVDWLGRIAGVDYHRSVSALTHVP